MLQFSVAFTAALRLGPTGSMLQKPDQQGLWHKKGFEGITELLRDVLRPYSPISLLKQGQLEHFFQDWVKLDFKYEGGSAWNYPYILLLVIEHRQKHRNFKGT